VQAEDKLDILLVDDKPENLLALEAVLQSPDYRLIKASSGSEALAYLLDHDCAIILLDVQMPEMDGFETASLIKASNRTRDIPIIFLTAISTDESFVHQGYMAGAVDYLLKPLNPEILKAKVAVFAALHRSKQQIQRQAELLRLKDREELGRRVADLELLALRREQVIQQKYRELVEGIDHAVIWAAAPGLLTFTFVSPSAARILGYPLQDWLKEPNFWTKHLHPDDKERVLAKLAVAPPPPVTAPSVGSTRTRSWPCPRCGAPMRIVERLTARQLFLQASPTSSGREKGRRGPRRSGRPPPWRRTGLRPGPVGAARRPAWRGRAR